MALASASAAISANSTANITDAASNSAEIVSPAASAAFTIVDAATAASATVAAAVVDAAASAVANAFAITGEAANSDLDLIEAHTSARSLFRMPLWPDGMAGEATEIGSSLRERLAGDAAFAFWVKWYEAMRDGIAVDWAMLEEIVLIGNSTWSGGPDPVAEEIAKIETKFSAAPAEGAFRSQARRMLVEPRAVGAEAEGLDALIEEALELYRRETGMNRLPEPLLALEELPSRLRTLSAAVEEAAADRINDLEAEAINAVRKIERLEAALAATAETVALLARQIREAEALHASEIAKLPQRTFSAARDSLLTDGARKYVMATATVMGTATGLVLVGGMWSLLGRPMEADLSELSAFAKSLRVGSR